MTRREWAALAWGLLLGLGLAAAVALVLWPARCAKCGAACELIEEAWSAVANACLEVVEAQDRQIRACYGIGQ